MKDILFAIEELEIDEDLLVLAGDNLLDFSLSGFISFFAEKQSTCIMRHYEPSLAALQRTGVATIDTSDKVLLMEEKPKEPKSNWAVPPFYVYKREDLPLIRKAIDSGCNTDAPGSFIAWLCSHTPVYAYPMPGKRWDIGNLQSYEQVKQEFDGSRLLKQYEYTRKYLPMHVATLKIPCQGAGTPGQSRCCDKKQEHVQHLA